MIVRRREVLVACGGFAVIPGCNASLGTYDLVVTNCTDEEMAAGVGVRRDGEDERVLEERYDVPANSSSDIADGIQVEDVFPEGDTYEIRVELDGRSTVTESVSVRQEAVENNDENVNVEIGNEEVSIY